MQTKEKYEAKIWIEDNQILCCSQMCTPDCNRFGQCVNVTITIQEEEKQCHH